MQEQYFSDANRKIDTTQYRNERAMKFTKFVRKIVKAVDELEKRGRGMHNAGIFEIIWQRVSNAELSQYLAALEVKFQHQPHNYREVLQDIASKVPSIGIDTLWKASEVSVQGTETGGSPDQGVYDSNGVLFHGTYLEKNGSVIMSNLIGKISTEIAMQLIAISIALQPDTGVILIEKNETKRNVKSQR